MLIQRTLSLSLHRTRTLMASASLPHYSIIRPPSPFPIYSPRFFSPIPQSLPCPPSNPTALLQIGGVKMAKDDVARENDPANTVPNAIFAKLGMQLHRRDDHPIGILKNAIYEYFDANCLGSFVRFDDLSPVVSVKANFDDVLVPANHNRSYNDTYYVDAQTVLRCHTSAHQAELLKIGHSNFLVTGDVYRRDSIDSTHYPVFHQMEGVRVFTSDEWVDSGLDGASYAAIDLKKSLEGLAQKLFGDVEMRWIDTYFPFTNPSFELEINFSGCNYVCRHEGYKLCQKT